MGILKAIFTAIIFLFSLSLFAQETDSWKGLIGINQGSNATYLTLGGPGISYGNAKYEISLRLLPAIRYQNQQEAQEASSRLIPVVGGGLQWRYRKWILSAPLGYFAKGKWEWALGIAYVLNKSKRKKEN